MTTHPLRSTLFMPASNPRAIAKARGLTCDAVVLDLEDAVAPEAKEAARIAAVAAVREGGFGDRLLVVRINALDTPWGHDDAAALVDSGVDAVLLPKLAKVEALAQVRAVVGTAPALWGMVETCGGVLALPALADAAERYGLTCLAAGTNDLAREMRCRPGDDRWPLVPALAALVIAARSAGIAVLDGVCNAIDAPDRLAAECRQALALGFDGKTLIHPTQIDVANHVFTPTADEVAAATRLIAAFEEPANHDRGAIRLDGAMVERLHLEDARRIMALAASR